MTAPGTPPSPSTGDMPGRTKKSIDRKSSLDCLKDMKKRYTAIKIFWRTSVQAITNSGLEEAARLKAQTQCVYISGLKGHHSLETGVAYHYRGHFIYACSAGNPIVPVAYSTSKSIVIAGVVWDHAPVYDPQAIGLVEEGSISVLRKAYAQEQESQQRRAAERKKEIQEILEKERAKEHNESESGRTRSQLGSYAVPQIGIAQAPGMPPLAGYAPQTFLDSQVFTSNYGVQAFASSAPGSRNISVTNSPRTWRPVSSTHHPRVQSSIRPMASISRLDQLLAEA